jgi:tetratricopeptide (TPR) repeat protein
MHVTDALEGCRAFLRAGRPEEAESLAREALDDGLKQHGRESVDAARRMATLGEVLVDVGRPKEALGPLAIAFKILAPHERERRRAAETLDWLGLAYEHLGDLRHAERFFLDALHIRERALGKDAPEIADSMDHLFHLYADLRHDDTHAEDALRRALGVLAGAGPEHLPHMVEELVALGGLFEREGRWGDSVRCLERAVRLRAQLEGVETPRLAPPLRTLGRAYRHAGNLEAAEYCCRRALLLVDAQHGGTPKRALPYVLDLIDVLRDRGKAQDERFFHEVAASLRRQSMVPPPPS